MTKNWFTNFIRNRDLFGNPITLSFNKKGNTHQTLVGGFVSIVAQSFLIIYILVHLEKLWFYLDDKITVQHANEEPLELVNSRDTSF